ncbi:hypothetical protein ASD8599_03098 [Ascidiaceihabitans donghaensis]|uniref:Uncharacterized protein n=1 Tax=Ascidiaceihabitans donghaensis TaxID=1510460 RepID=A0A2R8BGV0_9RHOB|nr:hypothetical protein [Ascidiaceihabitans donghaensis]SPH22354.1 hypothetical protein ASD8599_03098 [Ascidiaceihabitans donghaensis]
MAYVAIALSTSLLFSYFSLGGGASSIVSIGLVFLVTNIIVLLELNDFSLSEKLRDKEYGAFRVILLLSAIIIAIGMVGDSSLEYFVKLGMTFALHLALFDLTGFISKQMWKVRK